MTVKLTKADAIAFQQYLTERFGVMGDGFGMPSRLDMELVEDVVELPDSSLAFLVPSWRFSRTVDKLVGENVDVGSHNPYTP